MKIISVSNQQKLSFVKGNAFHLTETQNCLMNPVPNKDVNQIILFRSSQIFRKYAHCSDNDFFSS